MKIKGCEMLSGRFILCLLAFFFVAFSGAAFGADRAVIFSTSDAGEEKNIPHWGVDSAWEDGNNIRRNIIFMGDACRNVRVRPRKEEALVGSGADLFTYELAESEKTAISNKLNRINGYKPGLKWYFYSDAHTTDPWYISADKRLHPDRIAAMWSANVRYLQSLTNAPEIGWIDLANEPDYKGSATGGSPNQGSAQDYYDALGYMTNRSEFAGMPMGGLGTLNSDEAFNWFDPIRSRATLASSHNLAGACSEYVDFLQSTTNIENHEPEVHNVGEAILGAEYGLDGVIWWGHCNLPRGEFAQAAKFGRRLGYAEHIGNWTAAAVYRHADGRVQAFVGEAERTCKPTSYEFYCEDRSVFFDGYGPQRSYVVGTSGGSGYGTSAHKNSERVVNISWGDDVQLPVTDGRYVLVNRLSHKVMEVANGATGDGVNIQQNTYAGATYQQWDITAFTRDETYFEWGSCHRIHSVHDGRNVDVNNWSFSDGANIQQWGTGISGDNTRWSFEYVEDGWFYIRSSWNKKCIDVSGDSTADGANIHQWDLAGDYSQQWRLLPVGAAVEFDPPSAPTGVSATAGEASVDLSWTANSESDLAGYTVLRSTTSGGPYEIIGRGITATSFTDHEVTPFIQYHYVVRAVDESLNTSADSDAVSAASSRNLDPIAHYAFDGDVNDQSGNANHATAVGSPAFAAGRYGSGSLELNGSDQYAMAPSDIMAGVSNFTISAWVYWNGGADWQRIFDFGNNTTEYMFLTPKSGGGTFRFSMTTNTYWGEKLVETSPLSTGVWQHVAVTQNGDLLRLYKDGVLVDSGVSPLSPVDISPSVNYIGKSQWPDALFDGRLDELYIYNYALNEGEIVNLMNEHYPPSTNPAPMSLSVTNGEFGISWPEEHTGWRLQQNDSLAETNWIDVPYTAVTNAVLLPSGTNNSTFFRMVYP